MSIALWIDIYHRFNFIVKVVFKDVIFDKTYIL